MTKQDEEQFEAAWKRHSGGWGTCTKEQAKAIFNAGLYWQAAKNIRSEYKAAERKLINKEST